MSWFFGILKHIFGFEDEERRDIPRNRSQSDHNYQSSFPQTTSSSTAHCDSGLRSFTYPKREVVYHSAPTRNVVRTSGDVADFANYNKNPVVESKSALPSSQKAASVSKEKSQNKNLFSQSSSETKKSVSSLEKDLPFYSSVSRPPPISTKPTLSVAPSSSTSQKPRYVWLEKDASSTYVFPDDIKSSIEKDIIPGVLRMPLSTSTYKDYFHSLLYAEDYYLQKWEGFEMKNVTLKLHEAEIYMKKGRSKNFNVAEDKDEKIFIAFEIDKIPERRPFLLSRDFVSVQPSSKKIKPFQGLIYRVVKSNLVLAEFGEDFHSQHQPECVYDVKFSFNRICLKRVHQAIAAASDLLHKNFLFPGIAPRHDHELPSTQLLRIDGDQKEALIVRQISRLQGAPPCLVEGPISVIERKRLSKTGLVIVEAIRKICQTSPSNRILLCAPLNNTCDTMMRVLKMEIAESDMFRANAAFREVDGVPVDILPSCLYEQEMDFFACPSLEELVKYRVILSTYMSSYRLYDKGMKAGHFSHIFLVDNSSVTEPETMVPLANFANTKTVVVVTGSPGNQSGWIRSKIARQNGLMTSYFERLRKSVVQES